MEDVKTLEKRLETLTIEFSILNKRFEEVLHYMIGHDHDKESSVLWRTKDNERRIIILEDKLIEDGNARIEKLEKTFDRIKYFLLGFTVFAGIGAGTVATQIMKFLR